MKAHARPGAGLRLERCRRGRTIAAFGALALLAGCGGNGVSFLSPEGPVAALQRYHLWQVTLVSLIVVLPVLIGVPLIAWRYRYGNARARYTPEWDFSHTLEWVMWVVPALIVLALGTLLWIDTHKLDPYRPIASDKAPLRVEVVGLDWKWLFIYPDYHIATVGEMAFPQDRPVALTLTTDTVMQSFMISALGGQIYAMPGMTTKLNLSADRTGSFEGVNTQYSGEGFHQQHFQAVAMAPDTFAHWIAGVQLRGVALDAATYRVLGQSSTPAQVRADLGTAAMPARVVYFNDVAPGFFAGIIKRYHSGKAVSRAEQPGAAGYNPAQG